MSLPTPIQQREKLGVVSFHNLLHFSLCFAYVVKNVVQVRQRLILHADNFEKAGDFLRHPMKSTNQIALYLKPKRSVLLRNYNPQASLTLFYFLQIFI